MKSCTSIRANLSEAEVVISDKEFRRILGICLREANETKAWMEILHEDIAFKSPKNSQVTWKRS